MKNLQAYKLTHTIAPQSCKQSGSGFQNKNYKPGKVLFMIISYQNSVKNDMIKIVHKPICARH
ncbi:MAG: hypothetical protein PHI24_14230, partial [Desulfitobacteriaceae bacterium]|nr:hypothetical protein [Desulfitobacteriaceae bacterium]